MKHLASLIFFGLLSAFCCPGAEPQPEFSKVNAEISFQDPPRLRGTSTTTGGTRVTGANSKWAEIKINFTPVVYEPRKTGAERPARSGKKENASEEVKISSHRRISGLWLDNVVLRVRVILLDSKSRNKSGYGEVNGQFEFWSIAMDGREHTAMVFIPPQLLDRLMPVSGSGAESSISGKGAQRNDFRVEAVFFQKQYGVIGKGYWGLKGRKTEDQADEFKELAQTVSGRNIMTGGVLTRARTPWGLTDMNNYDLVKPDYLPPPVSMENAAPKSPRK